MSKTLEIPMFQPRPRPKFKRTSEGVTAYWDDRNLAPVREAIAAQWSGEPLSGKISLEAVFRVALPPRASKALRSATLAGEIVVPPEAATKLDCLLRDVLDALTGVVIQGERAVMHISGLLRYGETPGATLRVMETQGPLPIVRFFTLPQGAEASCAAC